MKLKTLFALFLGAAVLGGCQKDLDELDIPREELIPIQLGGQIDQVATSRVNDESFCDGDGVGIYVVNYVDGVSGTLLDEGNQADNVRFVFDEANLAWTPDYPIYYYDKVTPVDIIGYYPYSNIDKVNTYPFEVAKDQSTEAANGLMGGYEASDFLWGKAANITPTSSRVTISYQHRMAGVQVELVEGEGFAEGEWAQLDKQILVSNTIRKASIDLAMGVVTPTGETPTTGIVPAKSGEQWRAVVVPQTVSAQMALLNITVDGIPYIFRKSEAFEYVAGKLHKFIIEVKKKEQSGLEFKLIGEAITAWESETITHDGTAREYVIINVPAASTDGSALKAAIEASGKDYTKIKNLKVIGEVNANDFYFMRDEMTVLQSINMNESNVTGCRIPLYAFRNKKSLSRFVFPNNIRLIEDEAFYNTSLSGALIIPEGVISIGSANGGFEGPFSGCGNLTSLLLPSTLEIIGPRAFIGCDGLQGELLIPHNVKHIHYEAFSSCGFTGELELPENLETLGRSAFADCGFTGSVNIPSKIVNIEESVFYNCSNLNGSLILHQGILHIGGGAFGGCKFRGPLILPESVLTIGNRAFSGNLFSGTLKLPQSLISLGEQAFRGCERITGVVEIPEEILIIPKECFWLCTQLEGVVLSENVEQIHGYAFQSCYQLNSIVSKALVPPILDASAFDGVSKENFVVEVPEVSVADYNLAPNWNEFKRIAAHREFSISRNLFRTLNAEDSKTLILRAESGAAWSVESKPDWVTVTPSSGVGKTEVSITVNEMAAGNVGTFDVEVYDDWGSTTSTTYNGRAGEVVFLLDGKNYRTSTKVEQYDYEYGDGDVITNQTATVGNGVNIVFMGDCFDAQDIATGKYLDGINEAIEYFFAVEPYATYKDYFNVYTVFGLSPDSGMGTANTIREAKFGSQYTLNAGITPNIETCYEFACKSPSISLDNIHQSTIVIIENSNEYGGVTYMWGDGSSIAVCPMINDEYPYDFRGVVQHEIGGHAFGKLGDEYIYHGSFIQSCTCPCCPHVAEFERMKSYGFYDNLSLSINIYDVPWSHLIFDEKYQNTVDVYEGGYFHARGVSRSEQNSCMNNNIPYFSAISRQAIVERIMEYAGEEFSFEAWKAKDEGLAIEETAVAATRSAASHTNYVERSKGHQQPPKFMGEKPELNF